ncbi:MAG: ferritin [Epsilonproteobacteria bacterium]|nr:ferritin [Campylobacterota bacterium]
MHTQERKEIVDLDVQELIAKLNQAFADEWIAYYQYWMSAKLVRGPLRTEVVEELEEHAKEEYKHAEMLADRIVQLDGIPLISHEQWSKYAGCSYDATKDSYVRSVLIENIKGEQCAIKTYNELLNMVEGKDHVTTDILLDILKDEVEHEEDLRRLLEELDAMEAGQNS